LKEINSERTANEEFHQFDLKSLPEILLLFILPSDREQYCVRRRLFYSINKSCQNTPVPLLPISVDIAVLTVFLCCAVLMIVGAT